MNETLPVIYLAPHGETAWNLTGQHMGVIELPLTERGERNARRLAELRMPFGGGSTGSTLSAWNSPTRASTVPFCASSALA